MGREESCLGLFKCIWLRAFKSMLGHCEAGHLLYLGGEHSGGSWSFGDVPQLIDWENGNR